MPKYMLLIYDDPSASPGRDTPEAQREYEEYGAFTQDVAQNGMLVAGEPLEGTDTATTVRVDNGDTVLSDGPFADTKEWLAGYYVLECPNLDAATEQAARIPAARHGAIEVRPVMVLPDM